GALGAVGFPVILNVARHWRSPRSWSLHSKLTLATYGLLTLGGAVAIAVLEWDNPATLGELPLADRTIASLVAGVNSRSSGLSTLDVSQLREATWFIQDALMFIGGGPASTAGGIKVTTFAIPVLAIVAEARGNRDIEAFDRRLPAGATRLAVAVAFLGATLVKITTLAMLLLTDLHLDVVLYDVISAFATVGLSTGLTADLPVGGKLVLTALMFAGRTGTMTLAAALAL